MWVDTWYNQLKLRELLKLCPARGFIYPVHFVQFPLCSRSAGERRMQDHSTEVGCIWEEGLVTQCPPTGSFDVCAKYCLPARCQQVTCSPWTFSVLTPTSIPTQSSHSRTNKFFFLTSLLDFSNFFVWAQNTSFHSQHPHGNLLTFLSQFSDGALPWFPTSTSPFLFQTPCWINAMVSIGPAINRLL